MSHYIVLVKQVPDVSQITDNAFDPKSGNLVRSRLPSVINELDAQAFALATHLRAQDPAPESRIICLTMGPPMAAEVLAYGLQRGADDAILLTDMAMGGADTWATANPLAAAIRKLTPLLPGKPNDYLIIAGMQSVDGDTAQVPAQIAEDLDIPLVAYVTGFQFNGDHPEFVRTLNHRTETLVPVSYPAVVTVADYPHLIFASFASTRSSRKTIPTTWSAKDIDATALGVPGSKTRVTRVFPPEKTQRRCQSLNSVKELAQCIATQLSAAQIKATHSQANVIDYRLPSRRTSLFDRSFEAAARDVQEYQALQDYLHNLGILAPDQITPAIQQELVSKGIVKGTPKAVDELIQSLSHTTPTYQGDVWVMAECDANGDLLPASLELVGEARALADALEVQVAAVLLGANLSAVAPQLIAAGADTVHVTDHPDLSSYDPAIYTDIVTEIYEQHLPQIFLYSATDIGRTLAPRVAYRTDCGLTADCTSLAIKDSSRRGEIAVLMQTRPALGGNIMATIATKQSRTQMATVRPGIFRAPSPDLARTGQITQHTVTIDPSRRSIRILSSEALPNTTLAPDVDILVSGGKGLVTRDNYLRILTQLTDAFEHAYPDLRVQTGASRAAVEQGFIERAYQVGQTGRSVRPTIYLALGISGAIQHMIGLAHADTIIAINSDPHAPILSQCDYYLVATAETVAAELSTLLSTQGTSYADEL